MDEQALKELLLRENAEFRRAHEDHQACERALESLRGKGHPTADDANEERELKKKKLSLKDRMYRLKSDYLRAR